MRAVGRISVLILWMHTLSLVKSKDCKLEDFLSSRLYDSNFDISNLESTYSNNREVRVYCNIGYSGFFKLVCRGGDWTSKGKPCQAISCGHPGDAQFADFSLVQGDDFVFGSKVVYTCHKGYQMVSRINYRRCFNEGWDGVVPICEAQQCPAIRVSDNVMVNGDPEEATYGNVLRFSCKSKLDILDGLTEIYCNEDGEWSGGAPKCIELKCLSPEIENGYVLEQPREYRENDILPFTCNKKFKRTDERPSKCIKVGMRAEWSPMPQCEPTKCRLDLPPLEGTTYDSSRNVFFPGETLRVTCGEKHWIFSYQSTFAETMCNDEGQWTIRPVCEEVVCSSRRDYTVRRWSVWWNQRITLGDTATYSCIADYKSTDGSNLATCTRDGWKPKPLCQEIICDRLDLDNAINRDPYKLRYKNNDWATYQCMDGFTGNPSRQCKENGWTGTSMCTEINCTPKFFSDADTVGSVKSLYKYKEQVEYVCTKGYEGGFTLTCGKGMWIGTPKCQRKMCAQPKLINADIKGDVKDSYRDNDQIEYVCTYTREIRVARCEQGAWTGITNCSECQKAVVPNGFTTGPQGDKLSYTCNEGYKHFKTGWWGVATCINHVWSGLEQCIENTQCGEIPVIPNGQVHAIQKPYKDGESVQITCNEGFRAHFNGLLCNGGEWSSSTVELKEICQPKASNCDAPPKFDNSIIRAPYKKTYLTNFEVVYECRHKYMIVGESRLQCQDGEWEKKNITCAPYCEKPKGDAIIIKVPKDRFLDGDVLYYQCTQNPEHLSTTCVEGKWNQTVECGALKTKLDVSDGLDGRPN